MAVRRVNPKGGRLSHGGTGRARTRHSLAEGSLAFGEPKEGAEPIRIWPLQSVRGFEK